MNNCNPLLLIRQTWRQQVGGRAVKYTKRWHRQGVIQTWVCDKKCFIDRGPCQVAASANDEGCQRQGGGVHKIVYWNFSTKILCIEMEKSSLPFITSASDDSLGLMLFCLEQLWMVVPSCRSGTCASNRQNRRWCRVEDLLVLGHRTLPSTVLGRGKT